MLIADKGVAIVVMDKQDSVDKVKNLLEQHTNRFLPADPLDKYKAKLINILKTIKKESGIDDNT